MEDIEIYFVYGGGLQLLLYYEFLVLARSYMFRYSSYGPYMFHHLSAATL
jgi:hypothetical protein